MVMGCRPWYILYRSDRVIVACINMNPRLGALWGAVLGDVIGAPYERLRCAAMPEDDDPLVGRPVIRRVCRFTRATSSGVFRQWTDDTEMTLILAKVLVEGFDRERLICDYMTWANSCRFIGRNTRDHFKGIKTVRGYENRVAKSANDQIAQGNGPLMRASAFAVLCGKLPLEEILRVAQQDCDLTNRNETSRGCVRLYVALLHRIIVGDQVDPLLLEGLDAETRAVIESEEPPRADVKQAGHIVLALRIALWSHRRALLNHEVTLERALAEVVQLGGDTDTNACIAGGLIGALLARRGHAESPLIEEIRCVDTTNGDFPRPPEYHPIQLDTLLS